MHGSIRIRMYKVGLGDCFLLRFPGPKHMVIDCGSLGARADERLAAAVEDIAAETGGRVEVVVASHRRHEHVNGFELQARRWNSIHVDEVWMPWTEDPRDLQAVEIQERLDLIASLIERDGEEPARILARGATLSLPAFDVLRDGFAGKAQRRYLVPRDEELDSPALRGVHVRVLGPVRNAASLRRLHVESSFALSTAERPDRDRGPFGRSWHLGPAQARSLFAREIRECNPRHELDLAAGASEALGYWLDKTVANTSLLLLIRCGKTRLLFPGDSQWDSWLPVLGWEDLQGEIGKVGFYKVSQHGSHNGTPERLLGYLGKDLISAVSSERGHWPALPWPALLRALGGKGRVARSDARGRRGWVDFELPC